MDGLLWEVHQNARIRGARTAASSASNAASDARSKAVDSERRVDKLTMIVEALWVFMQREHGYTEQELVELVTEIDLRDGLLDGKVKRQPRDCGECGKVIGADKVSCMWCGAEDADLFGNKGRAQAEGTGPGGLAP